MVGSKYLFYIRNLYSRYFLIISYPLFGYLCAIVPIYAKYKKINPLNELILIGAPFIILMLLFVLYHVVAIHRRIMYSNMGSLIYDRVNYTFQIENMEGDLTELVEFLLHNPTKGNAKYLDSQYDSFSRKLKEDILIYYSVPDDYDRKIKIVSDVRCHERSWVKGATQRTVWAYDWRCEIVPPLPPGEKLLFQRYYRVKGTEKPALRGHNVFAFFPELPTKKAIIKIVAPLMYEIEIGDVFITDEAGKAQKQQIRAIEKPKAHHNEIKWEVHYPSTSNRYGFYYKLKKIEYV